MFRNYITTALRSLFKSKLYSLINIGGLAIGFAACILIYLFVQDEISYDKWIPNVEKLYTIETGYYSPGREPMEFGYSPGPSGPMMVQKIPEVIAATRIYRNGGTFTYKDKIFQQRTREVDANFFDFFDIPMVSGNREQGLADNLSILINEDMADKFFGSEDPLGKIITMDKERPYRVVGVFKNLPKNTHFDLEMIALFDTARYVENEWIADAWHSSNTFTYVMLQDGATMEQVNNQLPGMIRQNAYFRRGQDSGDMADKLKLNLFPVSKIHLYKEKPGLMKPGGDIIAVYTFSAVAILILIIASINFMNLATARSMKRAREVSMRKVLGASRRQLIQQFLGESLLTTFLGLAISIILVQLALPFYNSFLEKDLVLELLNNPQHLMLILGLGLAIGLFGGAYPAFFLSNFRPSKILRSNKSSTEGGGTLRNMLVVFQFSISIALIIATAIVYGQTLYAKNMDKGFTVGHKVNVYAWDDRVGPVLNSMKQEFKNLPGVLDLAIAYDTLPQDSNSNSSVIIPGANDGQPLNVERFILDTNYLNMYKVNLLAGRLFSEEYISDFRHGPDDETLPLAQAMIVNETFLQKAGYATPEDAVGQVLIIDQNRRIEATIVGVIQDLHSRSVRSTITPMMYWPWKMERGVITMELDPTMIPETMEKIELIWKTLLPEIVMQSSFVDEDMNELYQAEDQRGKMFAAFAMFAVFISCLGLYALASYAAERRTKEIGLRKVMGADVMDIVKLLVWQFSKPVLWANIIAWPLAWYIMQDWLNSFEYRISMTPLPFVFAGLIALGIAWGTVAHRANKVARTNPISALKYE